jgi:hypothetical protein
MPVTINGTTGIAGPDGSASTPAVQGTDSNTGLFFPAANEMAITANGSVAANFPAGVTFGFKNRIINGAMVIDQRNAGTAVTTSSSFAADRFLTINTTDGAFSAQQDSSAPSGFNKSLKLTITTADSNLTTNQLLCHIQRIEGFNIADLGWGTADAKTITLSFWANSSVIGTFGGSLRNGTPNRAYAFSYTINTANTWEYKTITIVGDTTGTWATNNSSGIQVGFCLGGGPDRLTTAGSWGSDGSILGPTGQTNLTATLNATFYITGVQFEIGSQATAFDWRPYGTELMLCQRYYFKITPGNGVPFGMAFGRTTSASRISIPFPVTMRAAPTALEQSGTAADYNNLGLGTAGADITCSSVPTFNAASVQHASVTNTFSSTVVVAAAGFGSTASATAFYAWSAEL